MTVTRSLELEPGMVSFARVRDQFQSSGIKQIAEALGISIGTVDRALHDRDGVSVATRSKVLAMVKKLNYRPNVAARSLKLRRVLRVAVHLPVHLSPFFDLLRAGIRSASLESQGSQVELEFRSYPRIGEDDLKLLQEDLKHGFDGFILTPGDPRRIDPVLRSIAAEGKSVLCVASDAPHSPRLGSVGVDAFVSGGIAAELLAMRLSHEASVAVVTGDITTQDHNEKLRGFAASLSVMAPRLHLISAVETHEQPDEAYTATLALLSRKDPPAGVYVSTANSLPVLRAVEERGLLGRIHVITTDLFPELVPLIESGAVLSTLHQRPFTQGKLAYEQLLRFLADGSRPQLVTKLAPHIVLRSNLTLFSKDPEHNALSAEASHRL